MRGLGKPQSLKIHVALRAAAADDCDDRSSASRLRGLALPERSRGNIYELGRGESQLPTAALFRRSHKGHRLEAEVENLRVKSSYVVIQRIGLFSIAVTALLVVACGRQVTPNPLGLGAGGAPPGFIAIHFDTTSTFNFQNYQYMVVFNTDGTGITPSTDTLQTNWAGYSFALVALGRAGAAYAEPVQFAKNQNPHIPPHWLPLGTTPNTFTFNPNSNGGGNEFSLIVSKAVFQGYASPGPSPTPIASVWTFNAFTTQANGSGGQFVFFDSLGSGGPIDPQFVSPKICMTEPFDNTYYANYQQVNDPAAEIVSVEISNNPVAPKACGT